MSGAEVAGLLLSALPLVTATISSVHELADIKHFWFAYERTLKTAERRVRHLGLRYDIARGNLFHSIVVTDEEQEQWIDETYRRDWISIATGLKKRAPSIAWDQYLDVMKDVENALQKLSQQVKLDKNGVDDRTDRRADVLHRVRFCTGDKHREKYFHRAEMLIDEFERMCPSHEQTNVFPTTDRIVPTLSAAKRRQIRRYHKFHLHLAGPDTWQCDCHTSHCIDLVLQSNTTNNTDPQFSLHFHHATPEVVSRPRWKSLKIKIREEKRLLSTRAVSNLNKATSHGREQSAVFDKPKKSILKPLRRRQDSVLAKVGDAKLHAGPNRVVFDNSSRSSSNASTKTLDSDETMLASCKSSQDTSSTAVADANIDLCTVIAGWTVGADQCLRQVPDPFKCESTGHADNMENVVSLEVADTKSHPSMLSLRHVLQHTEALKFDRAQRLFVAYQIASWHLPDQHEAWLNSVWTQDDIVFSSHSGKLDFSQPSVRRRGTISQPEAETLSASLIRLGILLLELFYGMLLEQHPARQTWAAASSGLDKENLDYLAALEMAELVEAELGLRYASAVKWCLSYGNVGADDVDKAFHEEVVSPLGASYVFFTGKQLPT